MKKQIVISMVVLLLAATLVTAIYDPNATYEEGQKQTKGAIEPTLMMQEENARIMAANGEGMGNGPRMLQGEGEFMLQNGEQIRFTKEGERIRLQERERSADCLECNLTEEDGKLQARLSNGRNAEIKFMPMQASERALQALRLHNCPEENCTIQLREVGEGNEVRMAYEVKRKAQARFLGIFPAEVDVEAEVDAETGEVLRTKKPWWASIKPESSE